MKQKKWFTLIEMLIVIVIIGILAAALIPRLTSARWRANDTARKADLQQIWTALISYQIDNSSFPTTPWSLDVIKTDLTRWWLASIPSDPDRTTQYSWIQSTTGTIWQYMYTPIIKSWFPNWWFVLMAKTETENGSNYVYCWSSQIITINTDFDNVFTCSKISPGSDCVAANSWSADCFYQKWQGQLRYIYRY